MAAGFTCRLRLELGLKLRIRIRDWGKQIRWKGFEITSREGIFGLNFGIELETTNSKDNEITPFSFVF
ncbi:hypothetical protein RCL_jg3894.t1 [Rhizophagus clarus]|uniref:Uncharacterized protein n=1 Tax=Rhizophagus clarus TaxID=94130 RepID=A0A8H3QB82_9GLOM|nr:hypothetical protein RCL_jg3894.t1 [Rhizophagus clarus]